MKIKYTKVGRPTKQQQTQMKKAKEYVDSTQYKIDQIKTAMKGENFSKYLDNKINNITI